MGQGPLFTIGVWVVGAKLRALCSWGLTWPEPPDNWVLSWIKVPLLQPERTFSLWGDDNVWYLDRGLGYTGVYICQTAARVHLGFVCFLMCTHCIKRKKLVNK